MDLKRKIKEVLHEEISSLDKFIKNNYVFSFKKINLRPHYIKLDLKLKPKTDIDSESIAYYTTFKWIGHKYKLYDSNITDYGLFEYMGLKPQLESWFYNKSKEIIEQYDIHGDLK